MRSNAERAEGAHREVVYAMGIAISGKVCF
jgi:hypothetical protein